MVVIGVVLVTMLASKLVDFASDEADQVVRLNDEMLGIDFAAAERTLLAVLRSDCVYCERSQPFYARLGTMPRSGVQIAIAGPPGDTGLETYVELLRADLVVFPEEVPARGTPSLLLIDRQGVVEASWIGLLDVQGEEEVLTALFQAHPPVLAAE